MNNIVCQARTWKNTRFHHQGRVKGVGCDCIGLVLGVANELGLVSRKSATALTQFDRKDYSMLPDGKQLQAALAEHLQLVDEAKVGDVGLFYFDKNPQHVGIFGDYPDGGLSLIHCYRSVGKVVEHRFDEGWQKRLVAVYSLIGGNLSNLRTADNH